MSLAGHGVIAIWNDILPAARADFYEWHNREHMPERVGIRGFLRGRRYIALEGSPEFFTLYETETAEVLSGADYLERLDHPTPWTRRVVSSFRDVSRSLCRVSFSLGSAEGGLAMTWRYDVAEGRDGEQRGFLDLDRLAALAERPGVCAVHLCVADLSASRIETAEKKVRADATAIPGWVIVVEGASDRGALVSACEQSLPVAGLVGAGAVEPVERGLYQLQVSRAKAPTPTA